MLGHLRSPTALLIALACALAPVSAHASSQDVTATHAYLKASYKVLHATVEEWPKVEAGIHKLDLKLAAECPQAGANSPQNEPAQKLTYEVAGAIWSTAYRTEAPLVQQFAHTVEPLRWSKPAITHVARSYAVSLHALTILPMPNLCTDVRSWGVSDFKTVPTSTLQFDRHVEAIEGKAIPLRLLTPYESASDKQLASNVGRLEKDFEHLESERGFEDWNTLLDTLGLNQ